MALLERDPNGGGGHTSRASNMSAASKGPLPPKAPSATRSDLLSSAPGVASMLRTSTELGNIGGIAYDTSSNMPNVPRAPHRSGASSRVSTGSSRSNNSRRDSRRASTQHNARPSSSARHSMHRNANMPEYTADTLSPTLMSLPGSSPLIPRSGVSRDGGRARSMTHSSQPNFSLNANRSYSSLRTYDLVQRPRSPYDGYPPHFRRSSGMRPSSPAVSDHAEVQHRLSQGTQAYPRMRVSSDTLVRRDVRAQIAAPPPPLRSRSPAYFANPQHHPEVPPVPSIPSHHRHKAVSQARIAHNQIRASLSSNSINQRTDSEAPSSDGPSPPTPRDGASMAALGGGTAPRMAIDTGLGISKLEQAVVDYYDGSEEFYEREELALLDNETIITGYGYGIRTIVEERLPVEPYQNRNTTVSGGQGEPAMRTVSGVEGIAELPASPVPRRITRDMVLRVISEPGSTTGCSETPDASPGTKASKEPKTSENSVSDKGDVPKKEIVNGNHQAKSSREFRHSIVSQAQTSLMESSTLELAVRYSSPDANGTASGNGTTEDGMSELLEGYQHTEVNSKSEADMMDGPSPAKDVPDKKSIHTIKSSEEQSFKSCTDLPEQSYKDADVKSFKTCQDEMTPDRAASLPASRMPSSSLTNSEARPYRPAPEVPLSSPSTILRKKHAFPIRESSFAKVSRMRANSKLSSRQGSTVTSISSAEGIGQQTPPVPPRESSSSKEAQRSTAVASYLLRGFRSGGRFSGFGSKIRNELSSQAGSSDDVSRSADIQNEVADRPSDSNEGGRSESPWSNTVFPQAQGPVNELKISIKKPESGPARQETVPNMLSGGVVSGNGTLPRSTEMQLATPGHNRSLSTPSAAIIPEPSSVYSSENNSSSYKSRVQSSPAGNSKSPERSRRDSQSTTHLVWPSRKPLHVRSTTTPERARKSSDQDDTTTDLRLSSFRQPHQMHYLPDLKEESHEDSSLNTSASNLKNSSFRFPAGQPSIRESVDDSLLPTRNGSLRSRRNSGQAQARGLPSMNFSRMDLVANLDDFFGPHSIRSLDAHSEETAEAVYGGVTRSATDGAMREKYRSVFGALEGGERVVGADQTAMGLMALKPRYSTRDIMSDIENLDVPSVRNLTERISELFPGLREPSQREEPGEFVEEEQIMEHVMGELQEVAAPAQKRSEARLRPLPGSPQLMVVDDAVYEELTKREKEGANAAAGDETKTCTTTGTPPVKGGQYGESPIAELEAPCVAKLRPRSLSFEDRPSSRHSVRKSQLSLPSTPTASTDTHPWYNDKNFPWATTTIPSIDISLPPRDVLLRSSPRPAGPSPLRSRLSDSSERTMSSPQDGEGSGIAGHLGDSAGEARISGIRRGVHYDIDNNLSPPQFDSSGYLAAPISSRGSAQQTHEAGDRYPTSSLSPPSHTNLPSLSHPAPARLSPDSDDEIAIASPRKRRLSILPRLSISRHAPSSSRTGDQVAPAQQHPELRESAQEQTQDPHQSRRLTFVNARGLTRQEFEMGRFKNKIKSAFRKVGSGFKKLVRREPSIEEIVPVRSPRRAGDREIPLEVQEATARMPESYSSFFESPSPVRRSRFSRFGLFHRRRRSA